MAMETARSDYRTTISLCLVLVLTCVMQCVSLAQRRGDSPERVIPWPNRVDNILEVGTNGNLFWVAYNKPPAFHVWRWSDSTIVKALELPYTEKTFSVWILPHDRWLAKVGRSFLVSDVKSGRVIHRWTEAGGLDVTLWHPSRIARHCAATARTLGSYEEDRIQIGIIAPEDKEFTWAATLTPDYGRTAAGVIHHVVPSDDGKFIGIAGWDNGVAMIDVVNKKVLWTANSNHLPGAKTPKERNSVPWKRVPLDAVVGNIAFAPDGKTVYVGGWIASNSVGAAGCVLGMNVETGETVSRWGMAQPRPEEYSRDVTTVAVSPDGRYVAAGTVPNGLVFLYSARDGQRRILNHGGPAAIDFASFSPDSKRLATFVANYASKEIKIWKLSEEGELPMPANPVLER